MAARSAEIGGELREALELYQQGLRVLMAAENGSPGQHAALEQHIDKFFRKAFATRELLKQERQQEDQEQRLPPTTAEHMHRSQPRSRSPKSPIERQWAPSDPRWVQSNDSNEMERAEDLRPEEPAAEEEAYVYVLDAVCLYIHAGA